ncbi:GNAT family N-acetyltransferase [Solihabitans fulvus]|uniref:GNAT family N-acetyltransferase n=1 Tax=Solihabitans fulvus TaxID=1892852 RepID=A0A5B2W6T2_9PSEU|nr:GNAT family N-acetyltransferase [Solihabitans fulvus]KAA2246077.1 GNAT family N-acetyltransferase [Solihabitans fulvus]
MAGVEVRVHTNLETFWTLARPLYAADPVRHTVVLTIVDRLLTAPATDGDAPPVLVTVHDNHELCGAVLRTPPWSLIATGLPLAAAELVAGVLAEIDPTLPGVNGPVPQAEAFAAAWMALTGMRQRRTMAMRVYRLGELEVPDTPGAARVATRADVPQLAAWHEAFTDEALDGRHSSQSAEEAILGSLESGAGNLLWEHHDEVVAWAVARRPTMAMSRIGPVYTPPERRGRGYGSAVTAAASQWAIDAGADAVVLNTDLANPVSNSIYQQIGYRPVLDAAELAFLPAHPRTA